MADLPTLPRKAASQPADVSTNESLVDLYIERAIDLLRLEAGTRDKVVLFLDELEKEIVAQIAKIDPTGVTQTSAQKKRLTKLLDFVRNSIRATYRDISTLMTGEIRDVADAEAAWTGSAFNAATHATFADTTVTKGFLDTLVSDALIQGASSKEWWSRQAGGLDQQFADQMRRGMATGETNEQLIERVRGTALQRGLMDISKSSAERLVRASVQAAANTAREGMYAKNTDLIKSLRWHATLDTRTSEWCLARDGHHYTPDTHESIDDAPPWLEGPGKLHWGCRSTSIPVLKSWRDLGIDADEVPHTTRASMDGQVPADMTFATWLKKQSVARQDEVLGQGKAQLWRDGKITLRDLLDQNGRPLTTEQLRAKYEAKK